MECNTLPNYNELFDKCKYELFDKCKYELFDKCKYELCNICKNYNKVTNMYECGGNLTIHTYECIDCQKNIKYTSKSIKYKKNSKYLIIYNAICSIFKKDKNKNKKYKENDKNDYQKY
jgi:hypothetical protein